MPSGNDLLMGGGKAVSFVDNQGRWVSGTVTAEPTSSQQADFQTGKLKFYDNGDPMMQAVVEMKTETEADPNDPHDDGARRLFIKGDMVRAVREAVKAQGAKGLEVGGQLAVRWVDTKEPTIRGGSGQKLYEAAYRRAPSAGNEALMGAQPFSQPAPVQHAPVTPAQPLAQPVARPFNTPPPSAPAVPPAAAAQMTPAQYAAPRIPPPPGVDPIMWAGMSPEAQAGVLALLSPATNTPPY